MSRLGLSQDFFKSPFFGGFKLIAIHHPSAYSASCTVTSFKILFVISCSIVDTLVVFFADLIERVQLTAVVISLITPKINFISLFQKIFYGKRHIKLKFEKKLKFQSFFSLREKFCPSLFFIAHKLSQKRNFI